MRRVAIKQTKPKYWIFQSNPTRYDLVADVKTGKPDGFWSANQFHDEMAVNDKIFFRLSGSKRGIYALGTIKSLPFPSKDEFGKWKVRVQFDGLIDPPLLRDETEKIRLLKNFRALRGAEGTNFKVPTSIGSAIEELIRRDPRVVRKIKRGVSLLPPLKSVKYKEPVNAGIKRRHKSQAHIREVEQAGVKAAIRYFFKLGLSMEEDCQLKGVGYDFVFANKEQRIHVEVKGISGSKIDFNLTPKELRCAKNDKKWRLLVVTSAISSPKIQLITGKELISKAKAIEATQYRVVF